ncbi:hypothetical protein ACI0X9_003287 [Cronobacter turicensis]
MSLKLVALIVFVVGITLLVGFLLYENSRRKKETGGEFHLKSRPLINRDKSLLSDHVESVHDFFDEKTELVSDNSFSSELPAHPDEHDKDASLTDSATPPASLPLQGSPDTAQNEGNQNPSKNPLAGCHVYGFFESSGLNQLYARLEDTLSGDFRVSPRIRVTDLINTSGSGLEENLAQMSFDFLLSDLESGEVRCVVMTELTMQSSPLWACIKLLLRDKHIPVYCHGIEDGANDERLSESIYNLIDETSHD